MHPQAVADLQRSGISEQDAETAGLFYVEDASTIYPDFDNGPALVIPYYRPDGEFMTFDRDGEELDFCRVRYLAPKVEGSFARKKVQRYSQPGSSGTRAYFAPQIDWRHIVDDAQEPVLITEGEKKAIATCAAGFPAIALGGVFNFTNGGDELMPELEAVKWRGRDTYICFDSDALTNPNILAAEARLVDELQRKRGARCFLVRLPAEGDDKIGLDDFLLKYGAPALQGLLQSAPYLGALDAKVVSLNKECAWIEAEGMVYDLVNKSFVKKDNFVTGSRFSALKHITVGGKQRTEPKEISIASKWLTHAHAARFPQILFRPGEGRTARTDAGGVALNMWEPWETSPGDVEPFLALSRFLFQRMEGRDQELPIKLLAYKAQHPEKKIPLALVLVGPQGCGKSLWGECVMEAFNPYSETINSAIFGKEFNSWIEHSLIATITEAKPDHMRDNSDRIKSLITDLKQPMRDLYRPMRKVNSYTFYVFASNERAVGSYAADDRRMIVVDCPPKTELGDVAAQERFYYDGVGKWKDAGGPKALLHYLLNMDLKGWRPPSSAPMTAEKHLSFVEGLTAIQALANDMKTGSESTIKLWLDQAAAWAEMTLLQSNAQLHTAAAATLEGVKQLQIRPWYEPRELALIFPNLIASHLGSRYNRSTPPGQISRELREAGVPYLTCKDDPRGFHWRGQIRQYLVVADFEEWQQPLSQADFERLMGSWPSYGGLRARGRAA